MAGTEEPGHNLVVDAISSHSSSMIPSLTALSQAILLHVLHHTHPLVLFIGSIIQTNHAGHQMTCDAFFVCPIANRSQCIFKQLTKIPKSALVCFTRTAPTVKQTIARKQILYVPTTPTLRLVHLCLDLFLQRCHRFPHPPVFLVLMRRQVLSVTVPSPKQNPLLFPTRNLPKDHHHHLPVSLLQLLHRKDSLPQTLHSSSVLIPWRSQQRRPLRCILLAINQDKENFILRVHLLRGQGLQHRRRFCLRQKMVFPTNPC